MSTDNGCRAGVTAQGYATLHTPCTHVLLFPQLSTPSVPSAAPMFTVNTTATSIVVTWQSLPTCDENGFIINYTIAYKMEGGSFIEVAVDAANRTAVVTPLTPFTNYTIKMAASTSVGRGEFGLEEKVRTDESGKRNVSKLEFLLDSTSMQPVVVRL